MIRRLKNSAASSMGMSSTSATVLPLYCDFEGLAVVAFAVADLAVHVHVGQEVHFDLQRAVTVAGLTSAAFDVEREAARGRSRAPGLRESWRTACGSCPTRRCRWPGWSAACGRSGSGPRASTLSQLVHARPSCVWRPGTMRAPLRRVGQGTGYRMRVDQRGFAGAGHAGDGTVNTPSGKDTSMSFRLFSRAPSTVTHAASCRSGGASAGTTMLSLARRGSRPVTERLAVLSGSSAAGPSGRPTPPVFASAGADVDDPVGARPSSPRRARRQSACCPDRAGGCRVAMRRCGCHAGAGRWTARRART